MQEEAGEGESPGFRNRALAKFITSSPHGDSATLQMLMKSGAEVSKPVLDVNLNDNGWLPIHAACQMGYIEVILLEGYNHKKRKYILTLDFPTYPMEWIINRCFSLPCGRKKKCKT